MHTYFRLFTLSQKKTNCYLLTHHTWKNVTALPCKMHNFFIWLKLCCIPPNVGGFEKMSVGVGIGGSEKNWNCVANGMSDKQRYSKCSKWPHSARIHASSLFATDELHCPPRSAEIQLMSQQDASATCPYRGLVLDTHENKKKEKIVHFTR